MTETTESVDHFDFDFLGQSIKIGDIVSYAISNNSSASLRMGKVLKIKVKTERWMSTPVMPRGGIGLPSEPREMIRQKISFLIWPTERGGWRAKPFACLAQKKVTLTDSKKIIVLTEKQVPYDAAKMFELASEDVNYKAIEKQIEALQKQIESRQDLMSILQPYFEACE